MDLFKFIYTRSTNYCTLGKQFDKLISFCYFTGIITLPNVSFACHLMSDVIFIVLLVANVVMKSAVTEYLGK